MRRLFLLIWTALVGGSRVRHVVAHLAARKERVAAMALLTQGSCSRRGFFRRSASMAALAVAPVRVDHNPIGVHDAAALASGRLPVAEMAKRWHRRRRLALAVHKGGVEEVVEAGKSLPDMWVDTAIDAPEVAKATFNWAR